MNLEEAKEQFEATSIKQMLEIEVENIDGLTEDHFNYLYYGFRCKLLQTLKATRKSCQKIYGGQSILLDSVYTSGNGMIAGDESKIPLDKTYNQDLKKYAEAHSLLHEDKGKGLIDNGEVFLSKIKLSTALNMVDYPDDEILDEIVDFMRMKTMYMAYRILPKKEYIAMAYKTEESLFKLSNRMKLSGLLEEYWRSEWQEPFLKDFYHAKKETLFEAIRRKLNPTP